MAYIAQYSERRGTFAQKNLVDDVPKEIKKQREKILTTVLKQTALENNKKYMDKTVKVLVECVKRGNNKLPHTYINQGKTESFKTINVIADKDYTGQFITGKINYVEPFGLGVELL